MEIGIIGFGDVGQAFTKKAVEAGLRVKISNSRGVDSLREISKTFGSNVIPVKVEEAAACEIVLLAFPWDKAVEILTDLSPWNGQILIDAVNSFHGKKGTFTLANVGSLSTSQFIAQLASGAKVVKALNMPMSNFSANVPDGTKRVAFLSGDDETAKQKISKLLETINLYPVDLGNLRDGGFLQQVSGSLAGKDFLIRI